MTATNQVRMLRTADIYDLYACEYILSRVSDADTRSVLESRVDEIHSLYMTAGKQRIRAEARFLGIKDLADFTFQSMIAQMRNVLAQQLREAAPGEANVLDMIMSAHQAAGMDMKDIDPRFRPKQAPKKAELPGVDTNWFKGGDGKSRLVNDPKWHTIAQAYIALENAKTTQAKIVAIDHLNDLQHNSFHLLIDLQTGRMLEGKSDAAVSHDEARKTVVDVLNIKRDAKTPAAYLDKTSSEVQKLWRQHRAELAV